MASGDWIMEEFARIGEQSAQLPDFARPVVTRPIVASGQPGRDSDGTARVPDSAMGNKGR